MSRLRPPPVEYVGYSKYASFTDTVAGTRHSIGSIARHCPPHPVTSMCFDGAAGSREIAGITCSRSFTSHPKSVGCTSGRSDLSAEFHEFVNGLSVSPMPGPRGMGKRFQWR